MTHEQASQIYDSSREAVIAVLLELSRKIDELTLRVQQLEDQIAKNSKNSSKPPSTDRFRKPAPKPDSEAHKKPSGGQKGHPGHTLKLVENPDSIVVLQPHVCKNCTYSLESSPPESVETRYLPPIFIPI